MKHIFWYGLLCVLTGCAARHHATGSVYGEKPPPAFLGHSTTCMGTPEAPDKEKVLASLRAEGVLTKHTEIVSARWSASKHQWTIRLKHPGGEYSRWTSDSAGYNFSGGSEKLELH